MDSIRKLLSWQIGFQYDLEISVCKCAKWANQLREKDLYEEFISIYSAIDYSEMRSFCLA